MAKMTKRRDADFPKKEMAELSDCKSEQAFTYNFNSICDYYNIDETMFKMDKEIVRGESFFPAETGELVALLVRAYKDNPGKKTAEAAKTISGTSIQAFYEYLLNNIEELPDELRNIVYCIPAHFNAHSLALWLPRCASILAEFVASYIDEQGEDVGALLKMMSVEVDKANYNLFFNQYILQMAQDSNEAYIREHYQGILNEFETENNEMTQIEKELQQPNISIDVQIARCIKLLMSHVSDYKEKFWDKDKEFLTYLSRDEYYRLVMHDGAIKSDALFKEETLNRYLKGAKKWRTIEERIIDGEEISNGRLLTYEEEIVRRKEWIEQTKKDLKEAETMLEEMKAWSDEQIAQKNDFMKSEVQNINKAYVDKCKRIRERNSIIKESTDNYIGRVLWDFLNKKDN